MQPLLFDINAIVLILGGILAVSALIVAQKPNAKEMIDKLVPFQTLIGIGLVVLGLIDFLWLVPKITDMFKLNLLMAATQLTVVGVSVVLGALLGMGSIMNMMGNNQAAKDKATQLAQKLAPYQVLLGLVGIAGALVYFLYRFKILTMSM
jgi:hypothetical protein